MKNLLFCSFILMLISGSAFASFPVNKENVVKSSEITNVILDDASTLEVNLDVTEESALSPAAASDSETKWVSVGLWFLLGGFAAHRWYRKKPVGWNILFILTAGGLGVWWLVDGINILTDSF